MQVKRNEYSNPPIAEVVFAVRYVPFKAWRIPDVGAFWVRVRDRFPNREHGPAVSDVPDPVTGLPLPRSWLISRDDERIIQIENGAFFYNWRRKEAEYPRYTILSEEFFENVKGYSNYCNEIFGSFEPTAYELTYLNHIVGSEDWNFPESTSNVVPWLKELQTLAPNFTALGTNVRYSLTNPPSELRVRVNTAIRNVDKKPILILELSMHGPSDGASLDNMREWFDGAHGRIIGSFDRFTSKEAQEALWRDK
jgi:uncharacterized protein (TIGR04255 family)